MLRGVARRHERLLCFPAPRAKADSSRSLPSATSRFLASLGMTSEEPALSEANGARNDGSGPLFHQPATRLLLLPYAECREDDAQDIVGVGRAGERVECVQGVVKV